MASSSNNSLSNPEDATSRSQLVANSSLTVTASEFVPSSANRNKYFKKSRNYKNNSFPPKNFSNDCSEELSIKNGRSKLFHERPGTSEKFGRQSGTLNFEESETSGGQSFGQPTDSPQGGSSKPSVRFSGRYYNGSRGYYRNSKGWSSRSTANHSTPGNEDEGAVGGEDLPPLANKENPSGLGRGRDRNGNRDQAAEHYTNLSHYNREYPSGRSKIRDRNENRDQSSDLPTDRKFYNDKPRHVRPEKEVNRSYDKESSRGSERSKHWDRSSNMEREASYSEDPQREFQNSHTDRGPDQYQDRYFSGRYHRRFADRNYERQSEDRGRNDYNCDYDSKSYNRGYGSRGGRPQYDFMREDRPRSSMPQKGRNSSRNFNTQETFDSEKTRSQPSEDKHLQKDLPSLSRKEHGLHYRQSSNKKFNYRDGDDVSQRERLQEQLSRGTLECLVCCDRVRQQDSVWSCSNCFHVLHLKCVIKWAKSSMAETGWRCPACQNVTEIIPSQYRCFCSKVLEPHWNRQDTPHTCGEVCGKSREGQRLLCHHKCNLLCHPGPCPPCLAQVTRDCGCGKTTQTVKCASVEPLVCESVCNKTLNCGVHHCTRKCHSGLCDPCEQKIDQVCFCKKQNRNIDCIPENQGILQFSCKEVCGHNLACGNHTCDKICHEGECAPCQLIPDLVTHCPCGKTELSSTPDKKRNSCTDPIPVCEKICEKKLPCGQPSNPHTCKSKCHLGTCPACPLSTLVRCRCGHMDRELPCDQLTSKADDARCEKKCTKKRSCAKHKCNQQCCIEVDHPCPLPCNRMLSCGQHRCDQLCHRGHCQPCWRTSFEELYCECGAEVLYPPVPCGTKRPPCSRPCPRQHDCEHPALHSCHNETSCPPCTVLTQKYCHGNHELRKSIPCHQKEFSCGLPCNKELPCGHHKCIQLCHKGECLRNGAVCNQPCTILRPTCQHPCSAPCHDGACPDIPCKETVRVTCECGHRSAMRPCAENTKEFQRIATSLLASKMADVQLGHSIDIGDIMGNSSTKKLYLKSLECTEECKVIERNRRMAIGLQIRNPDISQKLTPRYSEFMRGWAKKDPTFCQHVHDKLTELVKLAKESKQKSRSYSFEVMNREKRQFVHEYCEHFGCESVAYDQEPKRNVVATAQKVKAWLPSVSLMELIKREAGQRKVPGPMLNSVQKPVSRSMDVLSNKWATKPISNGPTLSSTLSFASGNSSQNHTIDDGAAGSSRDYAHIDHFNS